MKVGFTLASYSPSAPLPDQTGKLDKRWLCVPLTYAMTVADVVASARCAFMLDLAVLTAPSGRLTPGEAEARKRAFDARLGEIRLREVQLNTLHDPYTPLAGGQESGLCWNAWFSVTFISE